MNLADANRTILFLVGIALLLLSGRVEAATIIKINRTKKTVRILLDAAEVSSFKKGDSVSISVGKRTYVGSVSWEGADKALIFIPAGLKGFPEDGSIGVSTESNPSVSGASKESTQIESSEVVKNALKAVPSKLLDSIPPIVTPSLFGLGYRLLFPNPAQIYRISKGAASFAVGYGRSTFDVDSEFSESNTSVGNEGYRLLAVFTLPGCPVRLGIDYLKGIEFRKTVSVVRNRVTGNEAFAETKILESVSRPRILAGFSLFKDFYAGLGIESGSFVEKTSGVSNSLSFSSIDVGVLWSRAMFEIGASYIPAIDESDSNSSTGDSIKFGQVGQTIVHGSYFVSGLLSAEGVVYYNRWKEGNSSSELKDMPELGVGAGFHTEKSRTVAMIDYGPNMQKDGKFSWIGVLVDGRFSVGSRLGIGSGIDFHKITLENSDSDVKIKLPYSILLTVRAEYLL